MHAQEAQSLLIEINSTANVYLIRVFYFTSAFRKARVTVKYKQMQIATNTKKTRGPGDHLLDTAWGLRNMKMTG